MRYNTPSSIEFGAKVQDGTSDEQITVLQKLGIALARPVAIGLKEYNGKANRLVDFYNAGIKSVVNINWTSTNQLVPFVTGADLEIYKKKLGEFLKKYE